MACRSFSRTRPRRCNAGCLGLAALRCSRDAPVFASEDTPVGSLLRGMGFVTLGIAKVPEFCWWTTTQPAAFGPCRNPWNTDYSAGGSSGGSAAAVASGMVPFATGTEDGGSIRIPASFCGVIGLKPSRGLVPLPEPHIDHRLHAFGLCRTVRDAAALLDGLATGSPGGMFARARDTSYDIADSLPPLRIGIARQSMGVEASAECLDALESVSCLCLQDWVSRSLMRSTAPLREKTPIRSGSFRAAGR